jgi:hypothetical protein
MPDKPCNHPGIEAARYLGNHSRWTCTVCGEHILDLDCDHPPAIRRDLDDGVPLRPAGFSSTVIAPIRGVV